MRGQKHLETEERKFLPFIYASNPKFPRERFDRVKNVIFKAPYWTVPPLTNLMEVRVNHWEVVYDDETGEVSTKMISSSLLLQSAMVRRIMVSLKFLPGQGWN